MKTILYAVLCVAFSFFALLGVSVPARAQTETVLYNFAGAATDGATPAAGLITDSSGNLYGTTAEGGSSSSCLGGCGTVFELVNSNGTYKRNLLYSFGGGSDGATPLAALVRDSHGNLYSTTSAGGDYSSGTVFELVNSNGTYTEKTLYAFTGGTDGANPAAALLMESNGNLFGTTVLGGNYSSGTVFELVNPPLTNLNQGYTEEVLYSFAGGVGDGANPVAGLIADSSGNLYGTTSGGGIAGSCTYSGGLGVITGISCQRLGVVFELAMSNSGTWTEKVLRFFDGYTAGGPVLSGTTDGATPEAALTMDSSGNLYGTTVNGGDSSNDGTIFELVNANGTYSTENVLYRFSGSSDGANPIAPLIMGSSGQFLGTTENGGASGYGTAFELETSSGTNMKTLHSFTGNPDGANPIAGLMMDSSGNLYGTTKAGGSSGFGAVFKITFCPKPDTTTTLTSSPNPADAGTSVVLSATVADTCGDPAIGSVEFFEGATSLGTATLNSGGVGSVTIEDADSLGIGTIPITAQYLPAFSGFTASSGTESQTINEPGAATTTTNNTFLGNQTVSGSVSAQSFLGDGAGLTDLNPASLSAGTAGINITGNATSATTAATADNALKLGGYLPGFFATTGTNSFNGNQIVSGSVAAQSFLGIGSSLTDLNPASLSAGTAGINITGNAATATASIAAATASNALNLGGNLPSFYASTGANNFIGNQSITGNITASGGLAGASTSTGSLTIGSGGTPITTHVSLIFQNVAFNMKMHPTTCTVWSATVSSAADGDAVVAALSDSLMSSNIVFSAWAVNGGVNIRICNPTGQPTNVGAGIIRIDLWKH